MTFCSQWRRKTFNLKASLSLATHAWCCTPTMSEANKCNFHTHLTDTHTHRETDIPV